MGLAGVLSNGHCNNHDCDNKNAGSYLRLGEDIGNALHTL